MRVLALLLLCSCASSAAERKVLTVRNLASKCALIALSGCEGLVPQARK